MYTYLENLLKLILLGSKMLEISLGRMTLMTSSMRSIALVLSCSQLRVMAWMLSPPLMLNRIDGL